MLAMVWIAGTAVAAPGLALRSAWEAVDRTCAAGQCARHSSSSLEASNATDCKMRLLMYEFGLGLIPALSPQREVFDALEL